MDAASEIAFGLGSAEGACPPWPTLPRPLGQDGCIEKFPATFMISKTTINDIPVVVQEPYEIVSLRQWDELWKDTIRLTGRWP